jgi:hypothetical protein
MPIKPGLLQTETKRNGEVPLDAQPDGRWMSDRAGRHCR